MAEVFGAVASGIGIAGVAAQAIDGIRKLQAFCNDIRDAPEEVKYLTTELEILLGTIASIEAQIQRNSTMCVNMDPTPALRFVDQSVRSLNAVVEKLNTEIAQKRTMGSMKMAWKKKVLESHLMKIERSKTSLGLAVSAYSTELHLQTAMKTDTRIDQLSMNVTTLTASCQARLEPPSAPQINDSQQTRPNEQLFVDDGSNRDWQPIRKKSKLSNRKSVMSFTLMLPLWLLQRSLQIELSRTAQSWTLSLRPYRTISRDADIWRSIEQGDFDWFQDLIESGQATVLDRLETGWTLLHELAIYAEPQDRESFSRIAHFLVDRGADVNEATLPGTLAIHHFSCKNMFYPTRSTIDLREDDIFQLLLDDIDKDPSSFWEPFSLGVPLNTMFANELKRNFPLDTMEYPRMTMADRTKAAKHLHLRQPSPRELANYLGSGSLETAYSELDDNLKRDVLRGALRQWGCCSGDEEANSEEWEKTIQRLFAAGDTFEVLRGGEEREENPQEAKEERLKDQVVVEVIHNFATSYVWAKGRYYESRCDTRGFVVAFQYFISKTEYLGIRLEARPFCRRFEICVDHEFLNSSGAFNTNGRQWKPHEFCLYYDDDLSTWVMWDSMYETYCGEFWDFIDHRERTMPGTWVD